MRKNYLLVKYEVKCKALLVLCTSLQYQSFSIVLQKPTFGVKTALTMWSKQCDVFLLFSS